MTTFPPLAWSANRQYLPVATDFPSMGSPGCSCEPPATENSKNCWLVRGPLLATAYAGVALLSTVTKPPLLLMVTGTATGSALPAT